MSLGGDDSSNNKSFIINMFIVRFIHKSGFYRTCLTNENNWLLLNVVNVKIKYYSDLQSHFNKKMFGCFKKKLFAILCCTCVFLCLCVCT